MTARRCEVDPQAHPSNRIGSQPPRTRAWLNGKVLAEGFTVEEISDYLDQDGTVLWVDLCRPGREGLEVIREELSLHNMSVEDATTSRERAKLDRYSDYLFLNAYGTLMRDGELETQEISAFYTKRVLVTVRQEPGFDVDALISRWDAMPDLAGHGAAHLLYGLLDMLADTYLDTAQLLDDETGELEELIFDGPAQVHQIQERSFLLRKNLVRFRRVVLPTHQILSTLLRRELHLVEAPMEPYLRDVYDHCVRASEWSDSLREMAANLLETRLAIQSNQLNEVMKKITAWAAIIAVPTAVTGFYGQNVPYPGFAKHWGFVTSAVIMISISAGLYVVFKVRDWL